MTEQDFRAAISKQLGFPLQIEDKKPSYWDRIMSDQNRQDRYDDALLEAQMEAQREHDGENDESEAE